MNQYIEKGLGGYPRSPIPEADQAIKTMCEVDLQEALEIEKSL